MTLLKRHKSAKLFMEFQRSQAMYLAVEEHEPGLLYPWRGIQCPGPLVVLLLYCIQSVMNTNSGEQRLHTKSSKIAVFVRISSLR